jgi:hypothetical protein
MIAAVLVNITKISWGAVLASLTGIPAGLFFAAWVVLMGFMGWYRKKKFRHDDARSNWTAQLVNAAGQICLLLGVLAA